MAYITLNRQNLFHNLNQIALKTGSLDKVAIVLKDNAYGHGLDLIAKMVSEYGVRHAVVKDINEAEQIHRLFETVLILGDKALCHEKYSFAINTLDDISQAEPGAKVELKIDTGMHRNGILAEQIDTALQMIKDRSLDLVGVMTHFRSADEMGSEFFWQQKQFEQAKSKIKSAGIGNIRFHSHNTAAILRSKHFDEDLVRVGIGVYGYDELPPPFDALILKPVLSLHAKKVTEKKLKQGERIGYGGDFVSPKDMVVSTYDLGYGDGWNRASMLTAEGLPILGRISMDFITLESDAEEVCIMNNAQDAASRIGTISYEVLTSLSPGIPRKIV